MSNIIAPAGQIFVCAACGKTSPDRYGMEGDAAKRSRMWDESCMLNAVLCSEIRGPDGEWRLVEEAQEAAT